jgi:hypothetical protein
MVVRRRFEDVSSVVEKRERFAIGARCGGGLRSKRLIVTSVGTKMDHSFFLCKEAGPLSGTTWSVRKEAVTES